MDAQVTRRDNLGCATVFILWAAALLLLSLFVPDSQLRQTTGTITERTIHPWVRAAGLADTKYEYTVEGRRYRGERYVRYYAPLDGFLRVGSPILVWYDASDPSVSYAVNRPWRLALVFGAFIPLTIGVVMILFALRQ